MRPATPSHGPNCVPLELTTTTLNQSTSNTLPHSRRDQPRQLVYDINLHFSQRSTTPPQPPPPWHRSQHTPKPHPSTRQLLHNKHPQSMCHPRPQSSTITIHTSQNKVVVQTRKGGGLIKLRAVAHAIRSGEVIESIHNAIDIMICLSDCSIRVCGSLMEGDIYWEMGSNGVHEEYICFWHVEKNIYVLSILKFIGTCTQADKCFFSRCRAYSLKETLIWLCDLSLPILCITWMLFHRLRNICLIYTSFVFIRFGVLWWTRTHACSDVVFQLKRNYILYQRFVVLRNKSSKYEKGNDIIL